MKNDLVFDQGHVDVDDVPVPLDARSAWSVVTLRDRQRRQAAIFDPAIKKLTDALGKALPGRSRSRSLTQAQTRTSCCIWAGSDTDPGRYYIYDKGTRQLGELLAVRPQLAGKALAKVKPITFPGRRRDADPGLSDAAAREATGKGLPADRDAARGTHPRATNGASTGCRNFRRRAALRCSSPIIEGSSGYRRGLVQEERLPVVAQGDRRRERRRRAGLIDTGLGGIKTRSAIVGWSYGGYAALQSGVVELGAVQSDGRGGAGHRPG